MMAQETGEIITFYSYKGGTGRSMTLANVACLLALHHTSKDGRGVLMVDWDLEAPGLHRFFRKKFNDLYASKGDYQTILDQEYGLIDLFIELDAATRNLESEGI